MQMYFYFSEIEYTMAMIEGISGNKNVYPKGNALCFIC